MSAHGIKQLVGDTGDHIRFLFADAEQVVVVGGAEDDALGGLLDPGRLVDHHGRITRAGHDSLFVAGHGSLGHTRAARDAQHLDVRVREDLPSGVERGFLEHADQVIEPGLLANRAGPPLCGDDRRFHARGVRVHHQRVTAGDHHDRIACQGRHRVRHRCNHAQHTKRSVFGYAQPMVAADGLRRDHLQAGDFFTHHDQLLDLVVQPADLGLLELDLAEFLRLLDDDIADALDHLAAGFQSSRRQALLSGLGGSYGPVDGLEDPVHALGRARRCRQSRPVRAAARLQSAQDLTHHVPD